MDWSKWIGAISIFLGGFLLGFVIAMPRKVGHATCVNGEMWADWGEHGGRIISYKDDRILVNMKRQCKKIGE